MSSITTKASKSGTTYVYDGDRFLGTVAKSGSRNRAMAWESVTPDGARETTGSKAGAIRELARAATAQGGAR